MSGMEKIKAEVRKYAKRTHTFGALASEAAIPISVLQAFIDDNKKLPNDGAIDRLVKRLWRGAAVYMAHSDILTKGPQQVYPMGVPPSPFPKRGEPGTIYVSTVLDPVTPGMLQYRDPLS